MPYPVARIQMPSPAFPASYSLRFNALARQGTSGPVGRIDDLPHFRYTISPRSEAQTGALRRRWLRSPTQQPAAANATASVQTLSIGKRPNHHAEPVRHAVRRYFHAMSKWQRNQLLKAPGAVINKLYADLKNKPDAPSSLISNSRAARNCCDADALAVFLSAVAKEYDVSDQDIDPAYGMRMLQETLHTIVGMGRSDIKKDDLPYAIADYDFLAQARLFKSVTIVRKQFRRHLQNCLPDLKPKAARWLATQLLAGYEAVLDRSDIPGECIYGGLVFSNIQAGIDTAIALNIDPAGQSWETLVALADTIDVAARSNPHFDPLFYEPQIEAALRFANARQHIDMHREGVNDTVVSRAVGERDRARVAARNIMLAPVYKAIEFLQRPAPDRVEIADRHLTALGVHPGEIGREPRIRMTGLGLCSGNRQLRHFYLDHCEFRLIQALRKAGRQLTDLVDLDAQYSQEMDTFFTALTHATATLIAASVNQLDADDYLFWKSNSVRLLQAMVSVTELSGAASGSFGAQVLPYDKTTTIKGERALLFVAGDGNILRFYQVTLADAQISLDTAAMGIVKRITLTGGNTISNYIAGCREHFFDTAVLEEIFESAHTVTYGTAPLGITEMPPHTERSTQAAAAAFSSFIRHEQYEQGYQAGSLQVFRKTMGNLAKSMLPFHDCVEFVNAGRHAEAIADCSLEVLNVLPLSRVILFSQKLRMPLTHAFIRGIGAAGGYSLEKTAVVAAGMQSTLQAAGKGLAPALARDVLSAIDPGFAVLHAGYRLAGFPARFIRRNPASSLGTLIHADPGKYLLLQEILKSNPRTRALSDLLRRQVGQPYRYDRQMDGWYRRSPGAAEDRLQVTCAKYLPDDQCSMFVKQNPVTQKKYGPYLRPTPGNPGSLRLMLPLEPIYQGERFADNFGTGYKMLLPRGAEIEHLGFLKQHPLYSDLPDHVVLFELDGKHYAWDGGQPALGLRKVTKNLLEEYAPPLCRDKRGGAGNACGLIIKKLPSENSASRLDRFHLVFGRGNHEVTQYDPATRRILVAKESIEILYLTPPIKRLGQSQRVVLTPALSYLSLAESAGPSLRKINEIDAVRFGVDGVETVIPATGSLVHIVNADAAADANAGRGPGAASGKGPGAIEIRLKNGRHHCIHRVVFGTYASPIDKTLYGMIRLGVSDDSYYRVTFSDSVPATSTVGLTPATRIDIDNYHRSQNRNAGQRQRRKFNSSHRIQLNHGDAGSLLSIYEHYNLTPYRQLLPEIATQFGVDQIRAAAMVDAYVKNPHDPAWKLELEKLKGIFETTLHTQFGSPKAVSSLYERITDAILLADGPLRIRWLEMAPEDLDEIMTVLAERYQDMTLPLAHYKSMVGDGQIYSARNLRMLISNGLSITAGPKNVAFARLQFHKDGVLSRRETIHSISGRQQVNSDSYAYVKVKPLPPSSFDADADATERTLVADTDALFYLSDYDKSGNRKIRAFDAEIKTIGLIRRRLLDADNNAAIQSIKIFTRLAPCVVCTQALAMLSKEYPAIPIEVVHFARRQGPGDNAADTGNR